MSNSGQLPAMNGKNRDGLLPLNPLPQFAPAAETVLF